MYFILPISGLGITILPCSEPNCNNSRWQNFCGFSYYFKWDYGIW